MDEAHVIKRLKVRDSYSTDYFDDPRQGIPLEGYNRLFERMLDHGNITVQCSCELVLDHGQARAKGEGEEWINPTIRQSNNPTILAGGRLGGYRYYDMDQAVAAALEVPLG